MAIGLVYEGDGFIRRGPAVTAKPAQRPDLRAKAAVEDEPEELSLQAVEQRAKALRREYLNGWLCWLLDR
jgi:hypothetical protein